MEVLQRGVRCVLEAAEQVTVQVLGAPCDGLHDGVQDPQGDAARVVQEVEDGLQPGPQYTCSRGSLTGVAWLKHSRGTLAYTSSRYYSVGDLGGVKRLVH